MERRNDPLTHLQQLITSKGDKDAGGLEFSCFSDDIKWNRWIYSPKELGDSILMREMRNNHIKVEKYSIKPFESGRDEIINLTKSLEHLPGNEELLKQQTIGTIESLTSGIPKEDIAKLIGHWPLIHDLSYLISKVDKYRQDPNLIDKRANWIWDPADGRLDYYIGPDEHRLLNKTRLLGLIPFDVIDNLRETKIVVLGASVAASTVDLLVSIGAENITIYDSGKLDPAVNQRMPGGMGSYKNCGESKAKALMKLSLDRNPYGRYLGIPGKVLLPGESVTSMHDENIDSAIHTADLVIEVVDNAATKTGIRFYMQEKYPQIPLLYIADLGSDPIAGMEFPEDKNWFNQRLNESEKENMLKPKSPVEAAAAVYRMVDQDLQDDHRMQFLLSCLRFVPWWSQSPISSRESASTAAKLVIQMIEGENVFGKNIHLKNSPTSLIGMFNPAQSAVLKKAMTQILGIK